MQENVKYGEKTYYQRDEYNSKIKANYKLWSTFRYSNVIVINSTQKKIYNTCLYYQSTTSNAF